MPRIALSLVTITPRILYRDNDGFYNQIPTEPGFYMLTETTENGSENFLAVAQKGQYGSFEFHCVRDGEWINYSENIPHDAVVEYLPLDLEHFLLKEY